MQLPSLIHYGHGFIITSSNNHAPDICFSPGEVLGIHLQPDTHSYRAFLSTNFNEKKDGQLHLYYTDDYLQRATHIYPFLKFQQPLKSFQCNPDIAAVIINILRCNLSPGTAALYYEAKALELLTLIIDRISSFLPSTSSLKLSPDDIEMLGNARDILVADFENIPTIKQLARKVGTNDFKLKKAFKQYFGTSIFAYVQDVRLENARKLLIKTDHTITDIAYMTGYEHCNNFSVAFKRKFGIGVKGVRKMKEESSGS